MLNEIFLFFPMLGEKFRITDKEIDERMENPPIKIFVQNISGGLANVIVAFENKPYCLMWTCDYHIDLEDMKKAQEQGYTVEIIK